MTIHPSVPKVLSELRERYPNTTFLALGQTVFWDEPMKAVLNRLAREVGIGFPLLLCVHCTDYFAKLSRPVPTDRPIVALPHNDGTTRDLWSAAGELSCLFGSETIPTRQRYVNAGVAFDKVAKRHPDGEQRFIDRMTEAWGWRGLVHTELHSVIVHEVCLQHVLEPLIELLQWGFEESLKLLPTHKRQEARSAAADRILAWASDFAKQHPDQCLSALYQWLFPRFFAMMGAPTDNITTNCSANLLKLTPETAILPRFQLVDLFLNPETRAIAEAAYNHAVEGSEIYTLDRFGEGAIPFDLIVPKRGRGTVRVTDRWLIVETEQPVTLPLAQPVCSIADLARVVQIHLPGATLVGKAVALVSMLAREFLFVMNEGGSPYVWRTRKMNRYLREHGIEWNVHPILRLVYPTWDTLGGGECETISLPDHLADAFGKREICTSEFSARWRTVVGEQKALLESIRHLTSPREVLEFLAQREGEDWRVLREEYDFHLATLRDLRAQAEEIHQRIHTLYAQIEQWKQEYQRIERAKGENYRQTIKPLKEQLWELAQRGVTSGVEVERIQDEIQQYEQARKGFDHDLQQLREWIAEARAEVARLKPQRQMLERGEQNQRARQRTAEIEWQAELRKMELVRQAILVSEGLTHTDHRPTFWWIPLVDPSGGWLERITQATEMYLEEI
ncbi:MAG: hypothetical protein RMM08_10140 [Armatimonadota bacterium]|nr:hypothetical protein [bacterium]MDW8321713.1 hypothetical protein [Armatimonadota bacterium]